MGDKEKRVEIRKKVKRRIPRVVFDDDAMTIERAETIEVDFEPPK